jgi:hypothetical protein
MPAGRSDRVKETRKQAPQRVASNRQADQLLRGSIPQPTTAPAALWQLLLAASQAAGGVVENVSATSAGTITTAKNINVVSLIRRRKIVSATVTPENVDVSDGFVARLRAIAAHVAPGPVRERFVRWEIMRMQMLHGVLQYGCVTDLSEGREVRIPLQMTTRPHADPGHVNVVAQRGEAMDHAMVQAELFRIWGEVALRGGIALPSYYGLCKTVCGALLPHLSERELHQLISTEVELDLPDQASEDDPMTRPQFLRWMGVLGIIWMETQSVAEALTFVQHVGALLLLPIEAVDMEFYSRYGRRDPSLLVPVAATKACVSAATIEAYAREQLAVSVKVRFGSLLSDAPITVKARIKKRQRHTAGHSISAYMAPSAEAAGLRGMTVAESESADVSRLRSADDEAAERRKNVTVDGSPRRAADADDDVASFSGGSDDAEKDADAAESPPNAHREGTGASTRERNNMKMLAMVASMEFATEEEAPPPPPELRGSYYSCRFGLSSRAGRERQRQRTPAGFMQGETDIGVLAPLKPGALPPLSGVVSASPGRRLGSRHVTSTTPTPQRRSAAASLPTRKSSTPPPVKAPDASAADVLAKIRARNATTGPAGRRAASMLTSVDLKPRTKDFDEHLGHFRLAKEE